MQMQPIDYIEPIFRPPSEARSLILPVTNGCSWNRCTFCEMYTAPQKKFSTRPIETIRAELAYSAQEIPHLRRIFLADGDAMTLSSRRLIEILDAINEFFPNLQRISSYCLPRNIAKKSIDDLKELAARKLSMVYVGCESGNDTVLRLVHKGETFASSEDALNKLAAAGIKRSVMILTGLGGKRLSHEHAYDSAQLMNRTQPEYLSTLVVSFPLGKERIFSHYPDFVLPNTQELLQEQWQFINQLQLHQTIFRSDHASNYLVLKGTLNHDKERLLANLDNAINNPAGANLRPEWMRSL